MIPVINNKIIIPDKIQSIDYQITSSYLGYCASNSPFSFDEYSFKIELPSLLLCINYVGGDMEEIVLTPKELLGIDYETYIGSFFKKDFRVGSDIFNGDINKDIVFIIPYNTSIDSRDNRVKLEPIYDKIIAKLEPVIKEHSDKLIKKIVSYIKLNDNFDYLI